MEQRIKVSNGKGTSAIDMCIMDMKEFSDRQAQQGWFLHDSNTICSGNDSEDARARMIVFYRRQAYPTYLLILTLSGRCLYHST